MLRYVYLLELLIIGVNVDWNDRSYI